MCGNGLLGIPLHAGVNSHINLESVSIKIVRFTVLVQILVAPSEQRILLPVQRILIELLHLPAAIVLAFRFLLSHYGTQILPEICSLPHLMVHLVVIQDQFCSLKGICLFSRKETGFLHLPQHHITTFACQFLATQRIVK